MNQFLQDITPALIALLTAVLTALSGYVVTFINKKNKELQANVDNITTKKYMNLITSAVIDSVLLINQTYVNVLKAQGKFTLEAQKEAFDRAYENVMGILSADAIDFLEEITNDVSLYIKTLIESTVNQERI